MGIVQTLKFIINHPLNKGHQLSALNRFFLWQIGSRLVPGAVAVNFVDKAKLLVTPGMTGATGNIYTGLHEFEEMSFVLHLLRNDDIFIDVGANVGSYTVIASVVAGARSLSFEPVPETFSALVRNICLNDVQELVHAYNIGIGKETGVLRFTREHDTVNHVVMEEESLANTIEVRVTSLDEAVGDLQPKLIKIDVEGFEANVVAGASSTLSGNNLDAVILELNGSGARYGFDEKEIHAQMLDYGFNSFSYLPFERKLVSLKGQLSQRDNTLYVRNMERVRKCLDEARYIEINRKRI